MKPKVVRFHKEDVPFPHFNWHTWVVFTDDPEAYSRHVGTPNPNEHDTTEAVTMHWPDECKCEIVFKLSASPGTIAHEAWHALRFAFVQLNVTFDSEVVAYHLGYLVNEVHDIRKNATQKLRKIKT